MIDRFSRWPEIVPLKEMSADTVAKQFFASWISRFGSPKTITTDQGSQFESALFLSLSRLIGSQRIRTTPYHPASNGMIERWHRSLKAALMCNKTTPWLEILPTVLLGLRTCFKEDLGASSAEMLYGTTIRVPGEYFSDNDDSANPILFLDKYREYMRQIRPTPVNHHISKAKVFVHKDLMSCSHVFVRSDHVKKPLEAPYTGPFKVLERVSDRVFSVKINDKPHNISVERLKPAFIAKDPDSTPAPLRTYSRKNTGEQSKAVDQTEPVEHTNAVEQPNSTSTTTEPVITSTPLRTYSRKKTVSFALDLPCTPSTILGGE